MFLKILVSSLLLPTTQASASEFCGSLFANQKSNVMEAFQKIIYDDLLLQRIEDVRGRYENAAVGTKSGATLHLHSLLREVMHLSGETKNESEQRILESGIDNLLQDLVHISPRQISAKRILVENASILQAHLSREAGKTASLVREGNVVSLNPQRITSNSDYISARKNIFDLIDAYRILNHVSSDLMRERVEELLLADVRFQFLESTERGILSQRLASELRLPSFPGTEKFIEKYLSSKVKDK